MCGYRPIHVTNYSENGGNTLYLCLHGRTISSNGTNKIVVKEGSRLVICDCSGGVIKGNTATGHGGGVYTYRDVSVMNMSGGTIENNTAGESGGAIYLNKGQLNLMDAPVIRNNTVSDQANNVYLKNDTMLTAYNFESTEKIGVTTETARPRGIPWCSVTIRIRTIRAVSSRTMQTPMWSITATSSCSWQRERLVPMSGQRSGRATTPTTAVDCETCGYQIKNAESAHNYPDTWTPVRPGSTHTRKCQNEGCTIEKTESCVSDGKATCQDFAKCTVCGGDCGTYAPHSYAAAWSSNEAKHWHECTVCKEKTAEAEHTYTDYKDSTCDVCGYNRTVTYTVSFDAGKGALKSGEETAQTNGSGKLTSLPTPVRSASYGFDGWYTAAEGGTKITTDTEFTDNTTVYAYWSYIGAFTDVVIGSYYEDAVDWAVVKGVTTGTDATHFSPDGTCTRAQAVTFLWRAQKAPEAGAAVNPFDDVSADDYYYSAVLWAVENNVTNGITENIFSPGADCTRAQIVTFLWRTLAK